MSIVPEFILHTTISRGIKTLRRDSRLLDQLFRNLDQQSSQEMRKFIKTSSIDLNINYPRSSLKVPAVVILLKSESESQAFLGDSMGSGYGSTIDGFDYDGDLEALEIMGGAASTSTMSGQGAIEFGPATALGGTNNTIRVPIGTPFNIDGYENSRIHLVAGTGRGQIRDISTNNETTLMTVTAWDTNPDDSTVFEIRSIDPTCGVAGELIGEPSSLYDTRSGRMIERKGSLYALNYQIQVIGPNPELTIYLSIIIKSILTLGRQFLESQGLLNLQIGASDFVPRSEHEPDLAYMRALNLSFVSPFDVFEEMGGLATSLQIGLETCPKGEIDASFTTTSLSPETQITGSVQFVGSAIAGNFPSPGLGVDLSVEVPPARLDGDLIIATVLRSQIPDVPIPAPTPDRKWTLIASNKQLVIVGTTTVWLSVFSYPWRDGDPDSFTFDADTNFVAGALTVYRGVNKDRPVEDVSPQRHANLESDQFITLDSVSGTSGGRLISVFGAVSNLAGTGWTVAEGMNERSELEILDVVSLSVFDEVVLATGPTGVRTGVYAGGAPGDDNLLGFNITLRPS